MEMQTTELRRPRGRKDREGQEAVVQLDDVKESIGHFVELLKLSEQAAADYSHGIKAQAEKAGIQASVLSKFVKAKAGEKFEEKERDCRQLVMLFDAVV